MINKKDCVIMSSWIPSLDRMQPYIDGLLRYYNDCDIYVGVNPSAHTEIWLQKLKDSGLTIISGITPEPLIIPQHASAVQTALVLYKKYKINYNLVHFIHTKGIRYPNHKKYMEAFNTYFLGYAEKINEIRKFMDNNPQYGGWSKYGNIQYMWFYKKSPQNKTIRPYRLTDNVEMARDENSTNIVHKYFDWFRFYPFKYTPIRTQWLTGFYTIKDSLLKNFINNCTEDFFNKNIISELGFDMYMFETHIAQIVCRQGHMRYIDILWFEGKEEVSGKGNLKQKHLIDLWIKENKLSVDINEYV